MAHARTHCLTVCCLGALCPLCAGVSWYQWNLNAETLIIPGLLAADLWPAGMRGHVVLSAGRLWFLPPWWGEKGQWCLSTTPDDPAFLSRDHSIASITCHWSTKMASRFSLCTVFCFFFNQKVAGWNLRVGIMSALGNQKHRVAAS